MISVLIREHIKSMQFLEKSEKYDYLRCSMVYLMSLILMDNLGLCFLLSQSGPEVGLC